MDLASDVLILMSYLSWLLSIPFDGYGFIDLTIFSSQSAGCLLI